MKISSMDPATTPLQDSDVAPIVRSNTNYKTTLTNIAKYVLAKFGALINTDNIGNVVHTTSGVADAKVLMSKDTTSKFMLLDEVRKFVLKSLFTDYVYCGTFNTEAASTGTVMFGGRELAGVPKVVMNTRGTLTYQGAYTLKASSISPTGFTWTCTQVVNKDVSIVDHNIVNANSVNFPVDYIAIYMPSSFS